jgi:hypothetical protein
MAMTWLRVLGLRIAIVCALVSTIVALHIAVAKPSLPLALLDSFDQAFSLVYDAAERKVAELESAKPGAPPRRDVFAILGELGDHIAAMCDAAAAALDVELAVADSLSPERRSATLGCIEHHLGEARRDAMRTTDPAVRVEYEATCQHLRNVRRMI